MKTNHTPIPWHKGASTWDENHFLSGTTPTIKTPKADIIFCSLGSTPEETLELRDFTLRAVNSHESMKSALEKFVEVNERFGIGGAGMDEYLAARQQAKAALELAKKGEE